MTKLPAENRNVVGLSGREHPHYRVGPLCAAPGCSRIADHSHHIWRRSFLHGDYAWVGLWDGRTVGNLVGLCWRHHADITENRSEIHWTGTSYTWRDTRDSRQVSPGFETAQEFLLDPQPPAYGAAAAPRRHVHLEPGPGASEMCPTCGKAIKQKKDRLEEPRVRKSWAVAVPVDKREDGADVLDVLMIECARIFHHDDSKKVKYFTLVQALALVVQHKDLMLSDGATP